MSDRRGEEIDTKPKKEERCDYCKLWHVIDVITINTVHGPMTIKSCPRAEWSPLR